MRLAEAAGEASGFEVSRLTAQAEGTACASIRSRRDSSTARIAGHPADVL